MTDLAVHRGDFMAARNCIWFNNGVVCLTPQPVDDEYRARLDETSRRGPLHVSFPEEEYPRRQSSRDRIAEFLGARSRDVAFVRGVSEAYITVLRGIEWGPNDELIISTDEEAALLLPSLHLRDDQNVRVIRLPVDLEPDAFVGEFVARATSRTRLVALSQVTTNLGCRLPVRELCAAARERGVLTFVDTAHSAGLLDVQLEQLGCDFAGALSYKWMYGPYAAGLLWCQPALATRLRLAYAGNRSQEAVDEERMTYSLKRTAQRFEYGPWTWPVIHAWAAATKYVDVIGRRAIWDRTVTLASSLKDELNRIEGVRVLTPIDPARSAALVTFTIEGVDGETASRRLRDEYRIMIKHITKPPNALRASIAFFNVETDIEQLIRAVSELRRRTQC